MEKNREFYDEIYLKGGSKGMYFKQPEQTIYFPIWKRIGEILTKKESILEIGCGVGQLANYLLREEKNYIKGIDFSEVAIEKAKQLNSAFASNCAFEVKDIYSVEAQYLPFETIICCEVLEHLEEDLEVIKLLPSNVRFIFSVPNFKNESHVRLFENKLQIRKRYKKLKFVNIEEFSLSSKNNNKLFLIDSIVR
jgi:2-polyprenyl-3-methyl-5-hydroxy-6-metoxy-1,4-benzoquinol methylase